MYGTNVSNFDSTPLTFDPDLFPGKNVSHIAKSNRIFPESEDEKKTSFWHIWIAHWLKFFLHYGSFFSILAIFRRKRGVKVGPKVLTLGPSLFNKYSNPSKKFQVVYLFTGVLLLVRISRNSFFWLNLIASLVKHLYKLMRFWGVFQENPPKIGSKWLLC